MYFQNFLINRKYSSRCCQLNWKFHCPNYLTLKFVKFQQLQHNFHGNSLAFLASKNLTRKWLGKLSVKWSKNTHTYRGWLCQLGADNYYWPLPTHENFTRHFNIISFCCWHNVKCGQKSPEREREGEKWEKLKEKVDVVQVALRTAKLTRLRLLLWQSQGCGCREEGRRVLRTQLGSETIWVCGRLAAFYKPQHIFAKILASRLFY